MIITRREVLQLSGLFWVWRGVLLVVGAAAGLFLPYRPSFPYAKEILAVSGLPQWLYSWGNFDGVHYLTIAEKGYVGTGLIQAFFPTFPILIGMLHQLGFPPLVGSFVLTHVFAWLLLTVLFGFVKDVSGSTRKAWLSVITLLTFPTAFFLVAVYNEALFLCLVVAAFWAAHHQKWGWVSVLIILTTATRVVGIWLVPAMVIEAMIQSRLPWLQLTKLGRNTQQFFQKYWWATVAIALGSLGLLSFMAYLWREFHDPLYFLHVQEEFGAGRQESLVLYPQVVWRAFKILVTYQPHDLKYYAYWQEALAGIGGVVLLGWAALKKIRLSYLVFALGAFFTPTLTGTFSSMPRYLLVCFPIFFLPTMIEKKTGLFIPAWLLLSSLWLVFNTVLFIQGYWVA